MNNITQIFSRLLEKQHLISAVLSNPRKKAEGTLQKVLIRPVLIKEAFLYQVSEFVGAQVFHQNFNAAECMRLLETKYMNYFKQGTLYSEEADYQFLHTKKGQIKVLSQAPSKSTQNIQHNRRKNYLLSEEEPLAFLIALGVMSKNGKIFSHKMAKFRQINRFLELVLDVLPQFGVQKNIHIVDFGCGKGYLTFALYHFLNHIAGFNASITGVDVKGSVITECQALAVQVEYTNLQFQIGAINEYHFSSSVDMVIALHACDTATDFALAKAVAGNAKVILAAPCCQHELYNQISSQSLFAILQHGILKERFASLATDAARAQLLEMNGYRIQVLEFIESEHTPKNLLIRAIMGNSLEQKMTAAKEYQALKETLEIMPKLESLLPIKNFSTL